MYYFDGAFDNAGELCMCWVDNRGGSIYALGQGVNGKPLYVPLNFAVNIKLLLEKKKRLNKRS